MGAINVLPKNISELIAAGEVIERPASIVKELLENSIDAKSTAITIEIKRGGISYIRITDNGVGLEPSDMKIAFLRHATSKISVSDDLDSIGTLGFRGEALASISAVSKVEMTSKTDYVDLGSKIILEASEEVDFDDVGCADGTTIIVRDLFYNVPARLKFLKKDATEANAIISIVDKIAMSHPEISFKLISDNKVKLFTPGNNDLFATVHSVYGSDFSSSLMEVSYQLDDFKVNGLICSPSNLRNNRNMQHFFVNSRYVKSKTCITALEEAFKETTMVGRFPSCVLNIDVPLSTVDVNVHPAKIEVRFSNERTVFDSIYFAVKSTLSKNDILNPLVNKPINSASNNASKNASKNILSTFKNDDQSSQLGLVSTPKLSSVLPVTPNTTVAKGSSWDTLVNDTQTETVNDTSSPRLEKDSPKTSTSSATISPTRVFHSVGQGSTATQLESLEVSRDEVAPAIPQIEIYENNQAEPEAEVKDYLPIVKEEAKFVRVLGEVFKTYLMFEFDNVLYLMDKHAGHERILYEKLKKSLETNNKQVLLSPAIVTLSSDEFDVVMNSQEIFKKLGFYIDEFGNKEVIVREIPLYLPLEEVQLVVLDLIRKISENRKNILGEYYEHLLHSIACRSAIKANDYNSEEALTQLLQEIFENDDIRNCPHGRPIIVDFPKAEFDKKFGRI